MGFINSLEAAILDHVLNDGAYTPPTNWYVGLSSTTPTETGTSFTEPTGGAYARVQTTAAGWNAATGGDPSEKSNASEIAFPQATADWATGANMTHFGLFSAASGGTVQITGLLNTPKPILTDDTARFPAGSLRILLGDPTDSF